MKNWRALAMALFGVEWRGLRAAEGEGARFLSFPSPPFSIYIFPFDRKEGGKKNKKAIKNKAAPVGGEARRERRGHPALSPPGSRLCPTGAGGAGWAGGSRTHAPRPGHARPPPRARAVPPNRAHPAHHLQKKAGSRGQ